MCLVSKLSVFIKLLIVHHMHRLVEPLTLLHIRDALLHSFHAPCLRWGTQRYNLLNEFLPKVYLIKLLLTFLKYLYKLEHLTYMIFKESGVVGAVVTRLLKYRLDYIVSELVEHDFLENIDVLHQKCKEQFLAVTASTAHRTFNDI